MSRSKKFLFLIGIYGFISILMLFSSNILYADSSTYEHYPLTQVAPNTSYTESFNITTLPANSILTNVEVQFDYIAYGVYQNYLSARINKGSDPGSSGGAEIVAQGSLPDSQTVEPPGDEGTYPSISYKSFSTWNGQGANDTYYVRFYTAADSPGAPTINKVRLRLTYNIVQPDLVAVKAYMTLDSDLGQELTDPKVGDVVRFHLEYNVTDADASNAYTIKSYLDDTLFFSTPGNLPAGTYYTYTSGDSYKWTVTSGIHTIRWEIDTDDQVIESNEANNQATKSWDIAEQFDLAKGTVEIVDGSGNASQGYIGDTVYFKFNYSVQGQGATPAFDISCYLDNNTFWSINNISRTGGQSYSETTTGYTVQSGSHNIRCVLDVNNEVSESDETNNESSTGWTPQYPVNPQVSVSPLSGPQGTTFDQPSTGFTPNSMATLYFTGPDGSSQDNENTDGNGEYSHSWLCDACPVGQYSYYAVDDSTGQASNTVYFSVYDIPSLPDLTSSATVGCKFISGQTNVEIPVTINRSGGDLTSGSYVHAKLYWSTDDVWDSNDTVIWPDDDTIPYFPNSTLNNNGTMTVTATVDIPSDPAGTYYVISYADAPQTSYPNGFHTETDENNNTAVYPVSIPTNQTPSLVPLYRLYKSADKDHFYTTCANEKDNAVLTYGYNYEKIEAYVKDLPDADVVPLYRLYNPTITSHYYTTSDAERQDAIDNSGYIDEGIAGYVYPVQRDNTVPMYHLELESVTDHFYTISEFEKDNAVNAFGYRYWGIAMYVARNSCAAPLAGKPVGEYNGVDLLCGNFKPYYNHVDFANPPGVGIPFVFARTYDAMNSGDSGPLGPGWNHSYNIKIVEDIANSIAIVKWGDGRDDYYTVNGTTYTAFPGIYDTLVKGTDYILTRKDLTKYTFEVNQDNETARLKQIEDKNGNQVSLEYDAQENLWKVVDSSNREYRFTYTILSNNITDGNRYRLERIDEQTSLNRNIRFEYDANGNLIKYWDAENSTTPVQYEYNSDNLLNKIILPEGNEWTANFDTQGRILDYTIGEETTEFTYPSNGTTVVNTYNSLDTLLQTNSCSHNMNNFTLQSCEDGLNNVSDVLAYDTDFNPTQVRDKNNNTWNYTYNTMGNIETSTTPSPLNEQTTYEYDASDRLLTKMTDPEDNVTRYEYDSKENLKKIIKEDVINNITYDRVTEILRYSNGLIEQVTDPNQNTITYVYDYDISGYIKKITVTAPLQKVDVYNYDVGGRLTSMTNADGVTTSYAYDNLNKVTEVTDHQGRETTYNYDANGNLESIDDPRPTTNEKVYTYNNRDLLETITEGSILRATLRYDEIGRLTSVKNTLNRTWNMSYDGANNLKTEETPLEFVDDYKDYDGNGNLTEYEDRINRTITYVYDVANRLKDQTAPSTQYTYQYYANGLLQSVNAGTNRESAFEYTSRNNLKKYTGPYGKIIDYTYDNAGNLKTISFNGKTITYGYDERNLLETVTDWNSNITRYDYTSAGRLDKITYPNGAYIEYIYDPVNPARLKTLNNKRPDDSIIAGYTIDTFDGLDAPEQITTTGGISHSIPAMNISFTHDADNRINSSGFTYNDQGEILSKSISGNTTDYTWDSGDVPGLLTQVTYSGTTMQYSYDGLGNRIARTVNGVTTRYVLDMSGEMANVIAETDSSGNVTAYYIYGLGLIAKILPDNTAKYYHYDRIGNTVALTDSNGNVTDEYAYTSDPYGISVTTQGTTPNPFKFIGQHGVMDEGNNLYFMRARFYDADVGRFLNEDPIGFEGGNWNLYAYVGGNPIARIDPSGLTDHALLTVTYDSASGQIINSSTNKSQIQFDISQFDLGPFDYCGTTDSERIPDRTLVTGTDISEACKRHDESWGTLGYSKEQADRELFQDIYYLTGKFGTALTYYLGVVSNRGEEAYKNAQYTAAMENARKRREK